MEGNIASNYLLHVKDQKIALRAVVIDHAETAITPVVLRRKVLSDIGDVSNLSTDDEELTLLDLCQFELIHILHGDRLANTGRQLPLYSLKQWLERFKILTYGAVCNGCRRILATPTASLF